MFDKLAAEFPRGAISWRAQSLTNSGDKAMALAYIDARDVMERLDAVCGPGNWQDRYEFAGPKTICYLSINVDGQWVTKADGAGDTAVEAEKGAISDAFKRAAVKWGIGRYLYALDAPWVPCESYERSGKKHWKRWTADPWKFVKGAPVPVQTTPEPDESYVTFITATRDVIRTTNDPIKLREWWSSDDQKTARRDFQITKADLDALMTFLKTRLETLEGKKAA